MTQRRLFVQHAQRVDEVAEVRVGHFYMVPTVLYPWLGWRKPRPWPVIGPRHEDARFIGFEDQHYHVDGRFLGDRAWKMAERAMVGRDGGAELALAATPLSRVDTWTPERKQLPHPPVVLRRLKCRRQPTYFAPSYPPFPKLQAAFSGRRCARVRGALVCPHQGARLTMPPDADGNITCPLHGLRIDPATERVIG